VIRGRPGRGARRPASLLAGAALFTIPGMGRSWRSGRWPGPLSTALAGGLVGGLMASSSAGVPEEEAERYAERVRGRGVPGRRAVDPKDEPRVAIAAAEAGAEAPIRHAAGPVG